MDILSADWDNLVILDGCRFDVFAKCIDMPGEMQRKTSRGSSTPEFLQYNFADRNVYDTVYISSNAMIGELSDVIDVHKLVGLWDEDVRKGRQDDSVEGAGNRYGDSHIHPASVHNQDKLVERTINIQNDFPNKRIISHFLQPHTPFLVKDGKRLPRDSPYRTFAAVARGEVPQREIQSVYRDNVRHVLRAASKLIQNLDGKTVITADHGELLGEGLPMFVEFLHPRWPFRNRRRFDYGHYSGVRVPELVYVPWFVIESNNRPEILDAGHSVGVDMDENAINDQLKALGYR